MNTEIEVRILNIDRQDLISNLEKNNAKFIGDCYKYVMYMILNQ